jgi:hypothetical protein
VIRADSGNALYIRGEYNGNQAKIYLHSDSIYHEANFYDWLNAYYTDSLVIEDIVVRAPDDTSTYVDSYIDADVAIVRRSKFLNLGGSYTAFDFTGRRLLADSVTMTGCAVAGCDGAYGFYFSGSGAQPQAQILRSSFTQLFRPLYAYGSGSVLEVRNVTIDSAYTGVYAYSVDSVDVRSNVITRAVNAGVDFEFGAGARGPSRIAGNSITCTTRSALQAGVFVYTASAVVEQDTVTGCRVGIGSANAVQSGTRIRLNTLRTNSYAVALQQYDTTLIRVDSNGVSGSDTAAVYVYYAKTSLTHNRIENNAGDGLYVYYSQGFVTQARDNAFVNNTGYAVIALSDSVDASANYWGGGAPGTGPPNGVSGHINFSGFLTVPPPNLPGLAPPGFVVASSVAATAAAPPAVRREAPPPPVRAARVRPAFAPAAASNRTPERVAQIEAGRQRREAQEARRAEREARVAAEREALRAAREAERTGRVTPAIRQND